MDDYIKLRVEPVIAAHGHAVQYVGDPDDELQTFGYTVGLAAQGIPEILIIAPLAPDSLISTWLERIMPLFTREYHPGNLVFSFKLR